jgi:hypothetical protein
VDLERCAECLLLGPSRASHGSANPLRRTRYDHVIQNICKCEHARKSAVARKADNSRQNCLLDKAGDDEENLGAEYGDATAPGIAAAAFRASGHLRLLWAKSMVGSMNLPPQRLWMGPPWHERVKCRNPWSAELAGQDANAAELHS